MSLHALKEEACRANKEIVAAGLVTLTWGNVSVADRKAGVFAIKPSGVPYADLDPGHIVVVRIEDGSVVEGALRPSSDTATHLEIYRAFEGVGAVVHTHSPRATAWCQARRPIPCLGTTHADHFNGPVPVARALTPAEVEAEYEAATGRAIVETFREGAIDPLEVPAVLLPGHAPFAWGATCAKALENAVALEMVAGMALETLALAPEAALEDFVLRKHYLRKHGPGATYGQPGGATGAG